jgi:hypothetical protein
MIPEYDDCLRFPELDEERRENWIGLKGKQQLEASHSLINWFTMDH